MSQIDDNQDQQIDISENPKPANEGQNVEQLTIEQAMEKVGQKNKYQKIVTAISFITWFITTYGYMVFPYYLSPPDFECLVDDKWVICTEDSGACDPKMQVNMITQKESTIASDFNLYCEGRDSRVFIQSLPLFAGVMGTFTFGYMSDRFGRKQAIKLCWIMGIICSIFLNSSTNVIQLAIGNFGVGFSALILQNMFIIHMNEISVGQFRVMALLGMYIFWSISEMQYIWMLSLVPHWRYNMLYFYTIPFSICVIFAFKWIHDSPRYLYQKDRNRCLENLNLIAFYNKREQISDKQLQVYSGQMNREYSYLDLFKYSSQRLNTITISLVFLFVNFLYQGTQVVLSTVGNSFGENSFYVGIGELFGFAFSDFISHRIPRRIGIFYTLGATCVICMSFSFFPIPDDCEGDDQTCWQRYLQGFLISLARAISSLTFGLELLLCGEVYPATLKSLGLGFNMAVGFFGTFLAPTAVNIARELNITPIVFLGTLTFLGNIVTLFLPETLNKQSPLDIPENQQFLQNSNIRTSHNSSGSNQPGMSQEENNLQENEINELPEKMQEKKALFP